MLEEVTLVITLTCRKCGIKLAETVMPLAVSTTPTTTRCAVVATPLFMDSTLTITDANPTADVAVIPVAPLSVPVSTPGDSVISVKATAQTPSGLAVSLLPAFTATDDVVVTGSTAITADANAHCSTVVDMDSTPADTVKKRRRTAPRKIGANPTIVAITENDGKRKPTSRKKNILTHNTDIGTKEEERKQENFPCTDNSNGYSILARSNDIPPEKLVASWKDGITGVGQEFKSVYEFRDALQKFAIAHRFMYKLKKNDTNRASGRCIVEGCSWRIHASWDSSAQSFRIKNMNKSHTCGEKSWKSVHPTKNWLVSIIKDRLLDRPHYKPKEIANGILRDFGIELNYTQVWRGIEDAREQLQGSYKESYNQLSWFCEKMAEANPGSTIKLSTGGDRRFQHLFVSFHASRHGFQCGCRPILFLDATSLKSKYHEILLTATALDGDDGVFPVAFAIIDTENYDSWNWFLKQLRSIMPTSPSITFVTDREKALKNSVLEVFENSHHGYSIYHLVENFKKNLKGPFHGDGKGSLPVIFVSAAHAVRIDAFKMYLEQIKRVSSNAYEWVLQSEPEHWTNALFKGERYNHVTINVVELYTNWIEEVRELPIIQKVEMLRSKMMELSNSRRMNSSRWTLRLTPSKEEKLLEETMKAHGLKVLFSSDTLFEVHDDSINVVDIDKGECSCLGWKATGLPCRHAISVFHSTGKNVYDYCSRYFTVDYFHLTYAESINPVLAVFNPSSNEKERTDVEDMHVLPPLNSRPPSQQKKKDTKTQGVARRPVSCTRCKGAGHNKATCKATL